MSMVLDPAILVRCPGCENLVSCTGFDRDSGSYALSCSCVVSFLAWSFRTKIVRFADDIIAKGPEGMVVASFFVPANAKEPYPVPENAVKVRCTGDLRKPYVWFT